MNEVSSITPSPTGQKYSASSRIVMHVIADAERLQDAGGVDPVSISRAARLVAISREAQQQSVTAIRGSLRLLRQPFYPEDRISPGSANGDRTNSE